MPLAGPVAGECLFGWYAADVTAQGSWTLGGTPVLPANFRRPALAMVPAKDRIVPPASALSLAQAIPGCRIRMIKSGHIGMITGGRAKTDVYAHLVRWIMRTTDP